MFYNVAYTYNLQYVKNPNFTYVQTSVSYKIS